MAKAARWLAFLVAALDLVALGIFLVLFIGSGDIIFYAQMSIIKFMLVAWLIAAILSVAVFVLAVLSWKNHYWGTASRIHYSLVAVAVLGVRLVLELLEPARFSILIKEPAEWISRE